MRQHLVHSGLKPVHSFVLYGENASEGITIHEGIGIVGRDDTPIDEAYQYNVASITKPVVATIILQLVEEGRLQLDYPVDEYLAHVDHLRFKKLYVLDGESHAGEITIDHLLQHRSGIGDIFIDTAARFNLSVLLHPQRQYSPEMIMERFFSYGLNRAPHFKPGEGYYYSDINYVLLGLIVEQVTGDSLAHQIRRRVLRPLEMNSTYFQFYEPEAGSGKRLDTYLGPINVTRRINTSYEWAGGGLVSTTEDMATFIKGLFRLKLFEREATLHLMVDNSANEADGQTYARGIDHYLLGGETYYGHAGFYGSLLVYNPAEGIVLSAHLAQANPPYQVKGLIATVLETLEAPNADCVGEV
jgi:D-alanyl-D-alanine carboxypeptidase